MKQYVSLKRLIERNSDSSELLDKCVPPEDKYTQSFILVQFQP